MYNSLHKLKLPPRITKNYENKILKSHQERNEIFEEKPLYKMKIFNGVESKVMKRIKDDEEKLKARTLNAFYNTNNNGNRISNNNISNNNQAKLGNTGKSGAYDTNSF